MDSGDILRAILAILALLFSCRVFYFLGRKLDNRWWLSSLFFVFILIFCIIGVLVLNSFENCPPKNTNLCGLGTVIGAIYAFWISVISLIVTIIGMPFAYLGHRNSKPKAQAVKNH